MNQSPSLQPQKPTASISVFEERNPFTTLDPMPALSPLMTVLLSAFLVMCALFQPACFDIPAYALLLFVAIIAYLVVIARSPFAIVSALAVFVIGDLAGSFISFEQAGAYGIFAVAQMLVVSLGATLICTTRTRWLAVIPVITYGAAFLIVQDAALALGALLAMPAAGLLAYMTMNNRPRVATICVTSGIFGVCFLFGICLMLYRQNGAISFSALMTMVKDLRTSVIEGIHATFDELKTAYPDSFGMLGYDPATLFDPLINAVFNLLPAILILFVNTVSFAAQNICSASFFGLKMPEFCTKTSRLFFMSTPSAIIYLIVCVLSFFAKEDTLFTAVVSNIRLILLPGLAIVGFWKLMADMRARRSSLFFVVLIIATIIMPGVVFVCLSLSGAVTTMLRPFVLRMIAEGKFPPNDFHHDDNDSSGDDHS